MVCSLIIIMKYIEITLIVKFHNNVVVKMIHYKIRLRALGIDHTEIKFLIIFSGVMVAIILLLGEFYWHKRKLRKQRLLIRPFVS